MSTPTSEISEIEASIVEVKNDLTTLNRNSSVYATQLDRLKQFEGRLFQLKAGKK